MPSSRCQPGSERWVFELIYLLDLDSRCCNYAVTTQLDDGVRMLQMQAHNENGVIKLCHTNCVSLSLVLV
jgi:hypothetical protein